MSIVLGWLRLELRRRWRSLVVLALLIAISTATVLAAVAGARRGDTALERLLAQTLPATAGVLPNQPGFDWDAVRALPGVAAVATFPVSSFDIDGIPREANPSTFPFDRNGMDTVERPVVFDGRLADPNRVDEAVVSPRFVDSYGKGVGDTVTLRLFRADDEQAFLSGAAAPPADGPRLTVTIVGVVRSFWFGDGPGSAGGLTPSAALFEQYRANLIGANEVLPINALVRLEGGPAALPAFRTQLAALTGRPDIEMIDQGAFAAKVQKTASFESACVLAFGLAALLAAIVLVGQALARYVGAAVGDLQVLRAIGMDRGQAVVAACAGPALAALAGVACGVVGAIIASRWLPFGNPELLEPAPGIDVDGLVLGGGGLALLALVLAGSAAAGWLTLGRRDKRTTRRSAVAVAAARGGLPVPAVVGARFALEPGSGRTALSVRPTLVAAIAGVLGVLAAFTFSAGVSDAADNPARFGQTHQLEAYAGENGNDYFPLRTALEAMAPDPDVLGVLDARVGVVDARASGGAETPVTMFTHAPVGGEPFPTVLTEGRMPTEPDEVVIAPATAADLNATTGDRITVTGTAGTGSFVITGIGFVPYAGHNNYDDGGWLTPAGYDRLVTGFKFHFGFVAVRPGVEPAAVLDRLKSAGGAAIQSEPIPMLVTPPLPESAQIRVVEVLPKVLAGFLAVLAIGAVGHALATAVRRRRHDVAVLRALGMTRWQARGVVATQASLLAVIGLVFGIPLGLALGRTLWRVVADSTPLYYVPPVAVAALVLVVPLALLIANLLAAPPGRLAARLRIGHVLRAE